MQSIEKMSGRGPNYLPVRVTVRVGEISKFLPAKLSDTISNFPVRKKYQPKRFTVLKHFTRQSAEHILDFNGQLRILPAFGDWQAALAIPGNGFWLACSRGKELTHNLCTIDAMILLLLFFLYGIKLESISYYLSAVDMVG